MSDLLDKEPNKIRILLAEKKEDVLSFLISQLSKTYQIDTLKEESKLFEEIDSFQPDLLLLSTTFRQNQGIQLCQEIKNNEKYTNISIILIASGELSEENFQAGFEAGAIDYLLTPLSEIELSIRIHSALKNVSSIRQLKTLNKVKDNFISMVSHDIKTPLTSIIGFSELLLEEKIAGPLTPKQTRFVRQIIDAANHQNRIVKDLLNYSLLESGRLGLQIERHLLNSVLYKIYPEIGVMIKRKQINYVNKIPDVVYGWFDENRIMQVLENLISNAVKFTAENGMIEVGGYRKNGQLKVYVKDTGKGIPPENIAKILNKQELFTTIGTDGEKGTGLGISICSLIIKEHQGELFIESQPDQGTTISFTLPDPVNDNSSIITGES